MSAAIWRSKTEASISQAKKFQLRHPIGGVRATPLSAARVGAGPAISASASVAAEAGRFTTMVTPTTRPGAYA